MSYFLLILCFVFLVSGCVVRTYPITKDRIDQDLTTGNRGYLKGQLPPVSEVKERKAKRTTQVIEVEMHSPIRFEKAPKPKVEEIPPTTTITESMPKEAPWGNRGFITSSVAPKIKEPNLVENIERYTVQKGDTLQKISQKIYGTTKKWTKIYKANKSSLKGPNKIYPGQVIDIPVESLKETKENLK